MSNAIQERGYLRNQQAYRGMGVLYVDVSPDRNRIRLHAPTLPITKMMRQDTYSAVVERTEGKDGIIFEKIIGTPNDNLPYDRPSLEDIGFLVESENTGTTTNMTPEETGSVVERLINVYSE